MLPQILLMVVPLLVGQAEKLLQGKSGAEKHQWVKDALAELDPWLKKVCPDWAGVIEQVVDVAIVFAVDAMEK